MLKRKYTPLWPAIKWKLNKVFEQICLMHIGHSIRHPVNKHKVQCNHNVCLDHQSRTSGDIFKIYTLQYTFHCPITNVSTWENQQKDFSSVCGLRRRWCKPWRVVAFMTSTDGWLQEWFAAIHRGCTAPAVVGWQVALLVVWSVCPGDPKDAR